MGCGTGQRTVACRGSTGATGSWAGPGLGHREGFHPCPGVPRVVGPVLGPGCSGESGCGGTSPAAGTTRAPLGRSGCPHDRAAVGLCRTTESVDVALPAWGRPAMRPAPSPPRKAIPGAPAQAWAANPLRRGTARRPVPRAVRCSVRPRAPRAACRIPAASAADEVSGSADCSSGSHPHHLPRRLVPGPSRWLSRQPTARPEPRGTHCLESARWARPWAAGSREISRPWRHTGSRVGRLSQVGRGLPGRGDVRRRAPATSRAQRRAGPADEPNPADEPSLPEGSLAAQGPSLAVGATPSGGLIPPGRLIPAAPGPAEGPLPATGSNPAGGLLPATGSNPAGGLLPATGSNPAGGLSSRLAADPRRAERGKPARAGRRRACGREPRRRRPGEA